MSDVKKRRIEAGLIAICSFVYFVSYFSRKNFAAVMAAMITENVIDKVDGGYIGTGLFFCYGIGQVVSGYLGDKIRPKYLIMAGVSTACLCNLVMPLTESTLLMTVIWAINGFAQAMLWPPIVKLLSENLDGEAFIKSNFCVAVAAHAATISLYLIVPLCLRFWQWETVFYVASALAFLSVPVFALILKLLIAGGVQDDVSASPAKQAMPNATHAVSDRGYLSLLWQAGVIPVFLCIVMMGFLRDGIDSWLPTLYCEAFSKEASDSILISVVIPVFSILMTSAATVAHRNVFFANEVRSALVLFASCIVMGTALYFLIPIDAPVANVACLVIAALMSGFMHACNFMLISCLPGRFARVHRAATTSGFCNACVYMGAAISMYGIALIAQHFGWTMTILSWVAVAVLGVIFSLLSLPRYSRFINAFM